ncbi:hypothetical protein B1R27_35155 [Streptomyces sp. GKU 895]|nr:hypothetical protein B1R27_35155 [Streptomyces sp. GKU 895]
MARHAEGIHRRNFLTGGAAAGGAALLTGTAMAAPSAAAENAASTVSPITSVGPGDKRYKDLSQGWNQRWAATPERICLAETTAQVRSVVQAAVTAGKRLTVRSGGHCFEDWVYNPEVQVILDLSRMDRIYYDAEKNAVCVEPGAQLLNLYERLYRTWGVTVPAGTCFQVGVGGLVSGGGWGLLCRQLGLVVDHLYGVEVVCVDATAPRRSRSAPASRATPTTTCGGPTPAVAAATSVSSPASGSAHPARPAPTPPSCSRSLPGRCSCTPPPGPGPT